MMITVYVPVTYLQQMAHSGGQFLHQPSEFWLTRPDGWMAKDLATITVSPETWASWNRNINDSKMSSKQLLKD
jgi:hypothetical protein